VTLGVGGTVHWQQAASTGHVHNKVNRLLQCEKFTVHLQKHDAFDFENADGHTGTLAAGV
jgi:hypothetical protein